MTGRAVSFLAPSLFGLFAFLTGSDRAGIIGIMLVLAAGLVVLLRVPAQIEDRARARLISGESHRGAVRWKE